MGCAVLGDFPAFGMGDWKGTCMEREQVIRMAREACGEDQDPFVSGWVTMDHNELARFAALVAAAERKKLVAWMMAQGYTYDIERYKLSEWMGYTTSQGDATKDLLTELGWQIEQRIKGLMSDMECQVLDIVKAERIPARGQACT